MTGEHNSRAVAVTRVTRPATFQPEASERQREGIAKASASESHAMSLAPIATRLGPNGSLSLRQLAGKLTAEGLPTPAGAAVWTAATVTRVKARLPPNAA